MPDWLANHFGEASLAALFIYSFLSSTLLPGGSEIALAALVATQPAQATTAVLVATVGNTLGGLTSYAVGRWLPQRPALAESRSGHALRAMQRWGAPALLFSWLPLIGDLLCVAAGWLRIHWLAATVAIAAGKLARYALVAEGVRRLGS